MKNNLVFFRSNLYKMQGSFIFEGTDNECGFFTSRMSFLWRFDCENYRAYEDGRLRRMRMPDEKYPGKLPQPWKGRIVGFTFF